MERSNHPASAPYETSERGEGDITLRLTGDLNAATAPGIIRDLHARFDREPPASLTLDLERVTGMDDFGALILVELKEMMTARGAPFHIENATNPVKDILSILNFDSFPDRPSSREPWP